MSVPYTVTKETLCPRCGHFIDCASHPTDPTRKPKPGDLSICIGCGNPMIFTDDMGIREAEDADFDGLDDEQSLALIKMIWAAKLVAATRKKKTEPQN